MLQALSHNLNGEVNLTEDAIARILPHLRRYARALSGSQTSGDAYVAATLEALVEDPALLEGGRRSAENRVALYRAFTRIWNSTNQGGSDVVDAAHPAERHLGQISPYPRQAFLLVALEGFPEASVAEILELPIDEVRELVDQSGLELAAEIATDVLVIEDEPMIAMELESLVEGLGHEVVGVARTHADAIAVAQRQQPGLILADIRLADMSSGLEAVNELLQSVEVPVVFITAYPERFLTGERPEPAFLVTKPFDPTVVSAIISQALFFERKAKAPLSNAAA
jgi:CheY-like chemotaxis protein